MTATTTTKSASPRAGQIDLPGQAHVAEGPSDLWAIYLMHHAFRRDLAKFAAAVERTPVDDTETWDALAARWDRFFEVLHHHHSAEDREIWPVLRERATDDEMFHLDAMEAEHDEIDPMIASIAQAFVALRAARIPSDRDGLRTALRVRMYAVRDSLARHLAHEETEALEILQRVLAREEFDAIHERIMKEKGVSPLFLFPWCAHGVSPAVRTRVLKEVGLPGRLVLAMGERKFRRGERKAFKFAGAC